LLEVFDLMEAADRRVGTYSGGMRRRLDVAASLVAAPDVLFLDEPTTGLDPRSRSQVWEIVQGLVANGTTVLLTTQYLDEADRHARLERALRGLPDHQRVPLVLFHFEAMSYDQIAAALGVSLGKVKTDIHRGREALKKELSILDRSR